MEQYDEELEVLEVVDVDEDIDNGNLHQLIVHNDEVNTFDWVIQCLVEVCDHSSEQAEQCALIIHFKGKYGVKSGIESELKPMRNSLSQRGLSVTIERIED